jgi:predicted nucleic acid-binding protein
VTLVDTSAWVEYLRATQSVTHLTLRRLVQGDGVLHTTDVIIMEVLAGARDDAHADRLRQLLARCEFVATGGLDDFERAAAIYRLCRRAGDTIRALTDCLIAGLAIRADVDLLHADPAFEALARHTELRIFAGP